MSLAACIIDGMSLVHRLKGDGKSFAHLTDAALMLALHEGTDVVFDVYRDESIRNAERCNRGSIAGTAVEEHCTLSQHFALQTIPEKP